MKIVNRIKKSPEFALTIKEGKCHKNDAFTIHLKQSDVPCRVGISVSTKIGNAVVRNRIKRQVRAMCDELIDYSNEHSDLVIVVRKQFLENNYATNKQFLKELITHR